MTTPQHTSLSRRDTIRMLFRSSESRSLERASQHVSSSVVSSQLADDALAQYTAAIGACWHLSRGAAFARIEPSLLICLDGLEHLACHAPHEQQRTTAAHLAAQGSQLAALLAFHRNDLAVRREYCQRSLQWARLADDPSLLVAVLATAGSTFHYTGEPSLALRIYQATLPWLDQASPLAQSSLYMKQAEAYAQVGRRQEAEASLDHAYRVFPPHPVADPAFLYADCGGASLCLWDGLTYLALSKSVAENGSAARRFAQRAWEALELCGGPQSLPIVSERNHLEILNQQAATAIVLDDLDLFLAQFPQTIHKVTAFESQRRRQEATSIYWQARRQWPDEMRVKELAELFL